MAPQLEERRSNRLIKVDREDKQKQLIMDFQNTFASEGGKRVLADLRKKSNIDGYFNLEKVFTPIQVAFAEGQRSMMMHIYTMLKKDPYKEKQQGARNE